MTNPQSRYLDNMIPDYLLLSKPTMPYALKQQNVQLATITKNLHYTNNIGGKVRGAMERDKGEGQEETPIVTKVYHGK